MMKRLVVLLVVAPVLFGLCALMALWTPLPRSLPPAGSGLRSRISAVVIGMLGLLYLGGLTVYLASMAREGAQVLDTVLIPAGLKEASHLLVGRRYRGVIEGRVVTVTFLPAYGITPALLNVTISACLGTRMAIGWERPRLDCQDCIHLEPCRSELNHLYVAAEERERAHRLLTSPQIAAALVRLLNGRRSGIRELYVQPERIWLRARPRGPKMHSIMSWLDDLECIAQVGEALVKPREG